MNFMTNPQAGATPAIVDTDIPARLDRLALGRLPYAGRRRARRDLDSGRPGGDAGGRGLGRAQGKPGPAILQHRRRHRRQRLCRRRGAGRDPVRLAHRPARAQEAVLHHARGLPRRHRRDGVHLESLDLRRLPLRHRRRHRRRIHRHQFHHPGADPGALPRLDRPRHQRQLLDRRRDRRGRLHRAARSGGARRRPRLARRLPDRRGAGHRGLPDADVDSGIAALADDAWPHRRGRGHRRRASRATSAAASTSSR